MRFWVPICLMFICHFLFWVYAYGLISGETQDYSLDSL